jgi:hypothetical protein
MKEIFTLEEVANLLQIDVEDMQAHFEARRITGINVGISKPIWRFHADDVDQFLDALRNRTGSTIPAAVSTSEPRLALPGVFRLNIKTDAEQGVDPKAFCLKEGIAGVGWAIENADHSLDWQEYCQLAPSNHPDGSWMAVIGLRDIQDGSAIWTRSGYRENTVFWVGVVTGPWQYRYDAEARAADVVNIRPVIWHRVGGYDSVPDAIAKAFTPAVLSTIKQQEGVKFTEILAAKLVAAGIWPT